MKVFDYEITHTSTAGSRGEDANSGRDFSLRTPRGQDRGKKEGKEAETKPTEAVTK